MKTNKLIYWGSTGIIAAMMLFSGYSYFTNDAMKAAFVHFGFPDFFRIELGTAKILGVIALLLPMVPSQIKGFTYSGFAIVLVSAFIAHMASGDGFSKAIIPLVMLVILGVSYMYSNKIDA